MSEPFLGQVQIFGFNFAPLGWAVCTGQLLPIAQNTALFSVIGTTFGGDGRTTFGLPNLQSRLPIGANGSQGPGLTARLLGEMGGEETVKLLSSQSPGHTHPANCSSANGTSTTPAGNVWSADAGGNNEYGSGGVSGQMSPATIAPIGGGQAHGNIQPYLALNFCIALQGVFPVRG